MDDALAFFGVFMILSLVAGFILAVSVIPEDYINTKARETLIEYGYAQYSPKTGDFELIVPENSK